MRVGILGTGLIGASIGLRCASLGDEVAGCDRDPRACAAALERGAIARIVDRDDLYAESEVVVIALPLDATLHEVARLRALPLRDEHLVIDVASVKAAVEEAGRGIAAFVPTHPMAGSERSGPAAADPSLFEGRTWCYVATEDERRTARARAFIERCGATAVATDGAAHDRIVALTSHLPQLIAFAFGARIDDLRASEGTLVDALCGPVARELLRLSRSSGSMWDPIFAFNAAPVASAAAQLFEAALARLTAQQASEQRESGDR